MKCVPIPEHTQSYAHSELFIFWLWELDGTTLGVTCD